MSKRGYSGSFAVPAPSRQRCATSPLGLVGLCLILVLVGAPGCVRRAEPIPVGVWTTRLSVSVDGQSVPAQAKATFRGDGTVALSETVVGKGEILSKSGRWKVSADGKAVDVALTGTGMGSRLSVDHDTLKGQRGTVWTRRP